MCNLFTFDLHHKSEQALQNNRDPYFLMKTFPVAQARTCITGAENKTSGSGLMQRPLTINCVANV